MLAIQTKYLGSTDRRGSRVVASVMERKHDGHPVRRLTMAWDDALGIVENHKLAAQLLILRLGWTAHGTWTFGSTDPGYVFVCAGKHGYDRLAFGPTEDGLQEGAQ